MSEKINWKDLNFEKQSVYLQKARYLVEYNYISGDIEELAKRMYEKDKS